MLLFQLTPTICFVCIECRCGYQKRSMTNPGLPLFIGSASRFVLVFICCYPVHFMVWLGFRFVCFSFSSIMNVWDMVYKYCYMLA